MATRRNPLLRAFSGDAHHFAVLSGPGSVWLQSMPMPVLAAALAPYLVAPLADTARSPVR